MHSSLASGPSRKTTRYKFLRRFLMLLCNLSILSISLQLGRATAPSGCILLAISVAAQSQNAALLKVQQTADLVSPQCRMPGDLLYNLAPLQHVRSAALSKPGSADRHFGPGTAFVASRTTSATCSAVQ